MFVKARLRNVPTETETVLVTEAPKARALLAEALTVQANLKAAAAVTEEAAAAADAATAARVPAPRAAAVPVAVLLVLLPALLLVEAVLVEAPAAAAPVVVALLVAVAPVAAALAAVVPAGAVPEAGVLAAARARFQSQLSMKGEHRKVLFLLSDHWLVKQGSQTSARSPGIELLLRLILLRLCNSVRRTASQVSATWSLPLHSTV